MLQFFRHIDGCDFDAVSAEDFINHLGARLVTGVRRADAPGWTPETEIEKRLLLTKNRDEWKSSRYFVAEKDGHQYLFREAFCKDPYDDDDQGFQAAILQGFCRLDGEGLEKSWCTWVPVIARRASELLHTHKRTRRQPIGFDPCVEIVLKTRFLDVPNDEVLKVKAVRLSGISFSVITDDGREIRVENDEVRYGNGDVETVEWDPVSLGALEVRLKALFGNS